MTCIAQDFLNTKSKSRKEKVEKVCHQHLKLLLFEEQLKTHDREKILTNIYVKKKLYTEYISHTIPIRIHIKEQSNLKIGKKYEYFIRENI